jgi:hypothetical protein
MRPTVGFVGLLMGALGACAVDTGQPPRLDYAPPSELPSQSGSASVGQPAGLIWNQLLDRLIQASLQIDLADPERGIIVARYSGDPEPYVTCGWIVVQQGGDAEQVPAVGDASFDRMVERRRIEVNRDMNLDARLVVEVKPGGDDAAVRTVSNYVLTKTVVAADRSGRQRGSAREVVSFSGGGRGKFGKGTICQPTGSLERVVLDVLPRMAHVEGSGAPTDPQTAEIGAQAEGRGSSLTPPAADDSALASVVQPAESNAPAPAAPSDGAGEPMQAMIAQSEIPSPKMAGIPPLEDGALPLECPVADKIYCKILEVTGPYRRANQEGDLGLTVDAIVGSPLLTDSDLGFDVGLPSYEAYLNVSMFLKDGSVRHVLSGWDRRWPAHAREFVGDGGLSVDDRQDVELVVALASDVPVFPAPRPPSETAELFLNDLRQRLAEISTGDAPAQIAASLIVVTPGVAPSLMTTPGEPTPPGEPQG